MAFTWNGRLPGSGRTVALVLPDFYQLLLSSDVPNPISDAIVQELTGAGVVERPTPDEQLKNARRAWRGMYELAALCLTEPRLVLDGAGGDGTITPADLPLSDVQWICTQFVKGNVRVLELLGEVSGSHPASLFPDVAPNAGEPTPITPTSTGVPHAGE